MKDKKTGIMPVFFIATQRILSNKFETTDKKKHEKNK